MTVIDVHAHFIPPDLVMRLQRGEAPPGAALPAPIPPGMTDLAARRREMARQGVEVQWLTPWLAATLYALAPEPGAAWSRMLNAAMAEALPRGGPFLAGASVPLQDGRAAAAELEHALALGLTGAIIGTHANGKSLDDPDLEPFWAAAAAAGAPIMVHPFGLAPGTRLDRYHLSNLVGNPADTTIAAAQIIFGGVADRHPGLKILLVHGGGFFPYQFGRWNRGRRVRPEARVHTQRLPADYLRWFWYDTVTHSPEGLRYLTNLVGADRVALGTDYPFDMADPDPRQTIRLAGVAAAIESETPRAFLGIG